MQLPNLFGALIGRRNSKTKTKAGQESTPKTGRPSTASATIPDSSQTIFGTPKLASGPAATVTPTNDSKTGNRVAHAGALPPKGPYANKPAAPTAGEVLAAAVHLHKQGYLDQAETLYLQLLKSIPRNVDALQYLGMLNGQRGNIEKAILYFQETLTISPQHFAALSNLGTALLDLKRFEEALTLFDRAISVRPDMARIWLNRGNVLQGLERADEACQSFRRALEIQPDYVDAHNALAAISRSLGKLEEAAASFTRALELQPDYAELHANLASTLRDLGKLDDAVASYRHALSLKPDFAELHANLATTLRDLGRLTEAVDAYRLALDLKPDFAEAHNNLGYVLRELGKFDSAAASCRRALEIKPDFAKASIGLGAALQQAGQLNDAVAYYRKALDIEPDLIEAYHPLLLNLNYLPDQAAAGLLEQARQFGAAATKKARPYTDWPNTAEKDRCLRVGLVSGDLRDHPVGYFIESVLSALAAQSAGRLEVVAYITHFSGDAVSQRIKASCHGWVSAIGLSDETLARRIRDDRIDILIDLSGHSDHNRLPMFAWKPAPVQASWLGYFATTGLAAMDYLIADPLTLPEEDEAHFTETIWRLPETRLCFTPPDDAADVSPLPALSNGYITFGCFNNLVKINDAVLAVWAKVLQAVPQSRLFLKAPQLIDAMTKQGVVNRFAGYGIGKDRLILEGPSSRADYLSTYGKVDIALDPFPFTGGTTTVEAMWMGVPILTMVGQRFIARQGAGLLTNVGLAEWVATDPDDYVARAVQHAADLTRLATLRESLRQQALNSPVFDAPRFADHFDAALRTMWVNWCDQQQ